MLHAACPLFEQIEFSVKVLNGGLELLKFSVDLLVDSLFEDFYVFVVLLFDLGNTKLFRTTN